jgi:hypothetical protein
MNRYKNTFGYHTPNFSEKLFNRINKDTSVEWEDSSWHNDIVDSMSFSKLESGNDEIRIMLPNSIMWEPNDEEFNRFMIVDHMCNTLIDTEDIYEVIDFVNAMFPHEDYPQLLPHQKLN